MMKLLNLMTLALCVISYSANADLQALDDSELSSATGEGLGFAIEDFILDTETSELAVTGIRSSAGDDIDIKWTKLYVMGEGSQSGTIKTPGQIGSYNHPYVIRSVRGSGGLDPSDPSYDARYANIGNDLALLEFATDSYSSSLQNSETFGTFSYYQGCIWGEPGCDNLSDVGSNGVAVQAIEAEIQVLTDTRDQIAATYAIDLAPLESSIELYYTSDIVPLETKVQAEQQDYDQAVAELLVRQDDMSDAFDFFDQNFPDNDCQVGEECSNADANCPLFGGASCRDARDAYNVEFGEYDEQVGVRQDEYNQLILARKDLDGAKTDPNKFTAANGSYIEAVENVEEFRVLCGVETNEFATCGEGLIARKGRTRDGVRDVSLALFNGGQRRGGLDIGASFEFVVDAVDANGTSSQRTDYIDINMKGLFVDGTSLRLWSAPDEEGVDEINAEIRLNLFIKELDISVCDPFVCGADPVAKEASTLNLDNLFISLNLGYGETQPMRLSATSDGNFQFELTKLRPGPDVDQNDQNSMQAFYDGYYENSPKSFISISDVRIGSGPDASLGRTTVDGLRAQYLKVTSRDL